jgi:hypothetical protein
MMLHGSEHLKGKSHYEVLQWPRDRNMATTFEHTCRLRNPFSTIQAATASAEQNFSALRIIKAYLRSTLIQDSQLRFLSLEKALVAALKKNLHQLAEEQNFVSSDNM